MANQLRCLVAAMRACFASARSGRCRPKYIQYRRSLGCRVAPEELEHAVGVVTGEELPHNTSGWSTSWDRMSTMMAGVMYAPTVSPSANP